MCFMILWKRKTKDAFRFVHQRTFHPQHFAQFLFSSLNHHADFYFQYSNQRIEGKVNVVLFNVQTQLERGFFFVTIYLYLGLKISFDWTTFQKHKLKVFLLLYYLQSHLTFHLIHSFSSPIHFIYNLHENHKQFSTDNRTCSNKIKTGDKMIR